MVAKTEQSREIGRIVESQMRQWEFARQGRADYQARLAGKGGAEIDYIAISRQVGSGGVEVGRRLAEMLHWQFYDKEILDYMAQDMKIHKDVLESVDERTTGWIEECLAPIFTRNTVGQLEYYRHLVKVLLVIAKHGQAVIMGRAGRFVLPRDRGLAVRVIAPFKLRCERYAARTGIPLKEATAAVEKADRQQQQFIKSLIGQDIDAPGWSDIVFNTEKLSPEAVARLIWRALDQRRSGK
jgi:cytidylate kinase